MLFTPRASPSSSAAIFVVFCVACMAISSSYEFCSPRQRLPSCDCYKTPEVYELRCSAFTVRVKPKVVVHIQCNPNVVSDFSVLSGLRIGEVNAFVIRLCPLPSVSLSRLMQNIGMSNVSNVQITYTGNLATTALRELLKGLSNVISLTLHTDGTTQLTNNVFTDMPNLTFIDLESNNVVFSKDVFQSVLKLQTLKLCSNNQTYLEPGIFRNLIHLRLLALCGNILNISKAVFSEIDNLESLDINSTKMTSLPTALFANLTKLRSINLYANEFISLPQKMFINNPDLETLNLRDNRRTLNTLPSRIIADLTKLKLIKICNCNISILTEDLLWGSGSVHTISLNHNALITLPEMLFKDCNLLQTLDISFNRITNLPKQLFSNLTTLMSLKINNNQLSVITNQLFSSLGNLMVLDLKDNRLRQIETGAFEMLSSLKAVNMSNNMLMFDDTSINGTKVSSPLQYCSMLEDVQLANNSLIQIFPDWRNLKNLDTLNLAYNKISQIPFADLKFDSVKNTSVNVTYNNISEIDIVRSETDFNLSSVIRIYSERLIKYLPVMYIYIEGNHIKCDYKTFSAWNLQGLHGSQSHVKFIIDTNAKYSQYFKLEEYREKLIVYVPLKFYTCLLKKKYSLNCPEQCSCPVTLSGKALLIDCTKRNQNSMSKREDMSHNLSRAVFTDVHNLQFLEISAIKIPSLQSDLFLDLNKLIYINLYGNEFLSLPQKLFVNNPNLKAINIEDNRRPLNTLPPRFLSNLTNLIIVTIRSCNMSTLPEDLLWGSASLEVVFLNNNAFTTLPGLLFKDCRALRILSISYNQITDLPILFFSSMKLLSVLKINNNQLSTISNNLFLPLLNLRVLDLKDNRLRHIEPQAFITLKQLLKVDMSNNMLTFKDTSTVSPLRFFDGAKEIRLANNSITKIFSDWRKLKNLQTLNLAHNKISQIQAEDLNFILTNDTFVNISYNNISDINIFESKRLYKYVSATALYEYNVPVRHFFIEGNPINCDCKVYRFLQYNGQDVTSEIKLTTKTNTRSLQCVELEEYTEQLFWKIPIKYFTCLSTTEYRTNCPDECTCLLIPATKTMIVECHQTNLTSLSAPENVLYNLSRHVFSDVHNLETLVVKSNRMTVFPPDVFFDLINMRKISMYTNNLQSLPQNLFVNNTNLEVINIEYNKQTLKTLPPRLLANLTKLKEVRLNGCNIFTLPEDLLWRSSSINSISLTNNAFTTLPDLLFRDCSELQTLDISFNRIMDLPNRLFYYTINLKTLKINNNQLTVLKDYFFLMLKKLEILDLKFNKLTNIGEQANMGLDSLKVVDMSNNMLTFGKTLPTLLYLPGLEDIQLANNSVNKIFFDWRRLKKLRTLNLAYNRISQLQVEDLYFYSRNNSFVNVSYNKISEIDIFKDESNFKHIPAIGMHKKPLKYFSAEGNPIICDCNEYNLLQYAKGTIIAQVIFTTGTERRNIQRVKSEGCTEQLSENIPIKYFTCLFKKEYSLNCPEECSCLLRHSDKALRVDCQGRNLTSVPGALPEVMFSNYTELNLAGNNIKSVTFPLGPGYYKVIKYILTDNMISEIDLTAFSKKLQVLELDGNNISYFNETSIEFLMNFTSLIQLTLHNNPWRCDCTTKDFVTVVQSIYNLRKIKILDTVTCENGKEILQLNDTDLCPVEPEIIVNESYIVAALALLFGLLIGSVLALYYKFQNGIKIWLYAHRCCLRFVTEDELDQYKLYDAFVSYAHQDEEFVMDNLVPELENDQYKLCLHQRDWMPGELIPEQIARSVEDSRRTIIVLSPAFLQSVWSRMEFCAAHKQALSEGRVRVIVVMYEDIGPTDKLDPELRAYLTMNTYVKWGDQWFWDKLRYAMPHNLKHRNEIQLQEIV